MTQHNADLSLHASFEWHSASTEATIELGELLGSLLEPGDVVVLTGDLGAGKTQLTKGIARAMGAEDEITSPTFTIQMFHDTPKCELYHFDLYRLDSSDQLGDAGLYDVLGADAVCVIEWGEQFIEELGDERLDIFLSRLEVEEGKEPARSIRFVAHGARHERLLTDMQAAFSA